MTLLFRGGYAAAARSPGAATARPASRAHATYARLMASVDRRVLGSWLEGPRAAAEQQGVVFPPRGERLGLPAEGPGSIARSGRRLVALCVDWAVSAVLVLATGGRPTDRVYGWVVLVLFGVLTWG